MAGAVHRYIASHTKEAGSVAASVARYRPAQRAYDGERPEWLLPTEFCEWTPDEHDLGHGEPPLKGEMWFSVTDQLTFAVAGFWQATAEGNGFTMVTCDPNELVAPINPKAMITILRPEDCHAWLQGAMTMSWAYTGPIKRRRRQPLGPSFL